MQLTPAQCAGRLAAADHGVLCTSSGDGVDAVPVCFAVVHDGPSTVLASPIDRVKPKGTVALQRLANLERDPRATVLCEHWDREDWSQLWWVRAHLRLRSEPEPEPQPGAASRLLEECATALRDKYAQYRATEFARVLVFDVERLVGWAASTAAPEPD